MVRPWSFSVLSTMLVVPVGVGTLDGCTSDGRCDDRSSLLTTAATVLKHSVDASDPAHMAELSEDAVLAEDQAEAFEDDEEETDEDVERSKEALRLLGYDSQDPWLMSYNVCTRTCRTLKGSARGLCYQKCRFNIVPMEVIIENEDCNSKCWMENSASSQSSKRRTCSRGCWTKAQAADAGGHLQHMASWRTNYHLCLNNVTFTGSSPSSRTGKAGCRWVKDRKERSYCYSDCHSAMPAKVRVYKLECEDSCRKVPAGANARHYTGNCKNYCRKMTEDRIVASLSGRHLARPHQAKADLRRPASLASSHAEGDNQEILR